MQKTNYFEDFIEYYDKAETLQKKNLGLLSADTTVGDPLMDNIKIYDTVNRRYAGFSNMLQDLWYGSEAPKGTKPEYDHLHLVWNQRNWLYVFLVHRITGSGASFQHDHGYRNSILPKLAKCYTNEEMSQVILAEDKPIFTSIGNQIPPFNKPKSPYQNGGKMYLCEVADKVAYDFLVWLLSSTSSAISIQTGVDKICQIQKDLGWKQFHFVLTAWVMDLADYYPDYVDPTSHCYYGKNAKETLDMLWKESGQYDQKMEQLCSILNARPYDLEDVLCDYIRYVENYIPKGYEHLSIEQVTNKSLIKKHEKHPTYVSKQAKRH